MEATRQEALIPLFRLLGVAFQRYESGQHNWAFTLAEYILSIESADPFIKAMASLLLTLVPNTEDAIEHGTLALTLSLEHREFMRRIRRRTREVLGGDYATVAAGLESEYTAISQFCALALIRLAVLVSVLRETERRLSRNRERRLSNDRERSLSFD